MLSYENHCHSLASSTAATRSQRIHLSKIGTLGPKAGDAFVTDIKVRGAVGQSATVSWLYQGIGRVAMGYFSVGG